MTARNEKQADKGGTAERLRGTGVLPMYVWIPCKLEYRRDVRSSDTLYSGMFRVGRSTGWGWLAEESLSLKKVADDGRGQIKVDGIHY